MQHSNRSDGPEHNPNRHPGAPSGSRSRGDHRTARGITRRITWGIPGGIPGGRRTGHRRRAPWGVALATPSLLTGLTVLLGALTLLAQPGDAIASTPTPADVPLELEADRADIDAARGISIYTGNASLTHGEMRITGERMEVHTDGEGALSHIVVSGSPATFRDLPEGQTRPVEAEAKQMEYHARAPERAFFLGGAKLWQGDDTIHAETIRINLETQIVEALGSEQQRARTTLYPAKREER